jgi:putative hydrolase of the HAD superfamily
MFGLDGMSARALQKYYYTRYGTTLKGLMDEHAISPHDFLDFAHQIDLSLVDPDPRLGLAIEALPGRKLILTNGSRQHAENVSRKLGIRDHFEEIFDIVAADFVPKPETQTYEKFLALHDVDPSRAAMFEDLAKNLVAPAALGMKTVLVLPKAVDPFRETHEQTAPDAPYIHYRTTDLAGFLEQIETVRGVRSAPPLPKG